jgi:imidazolonepropionase-like amidohydrolase
VEVVRAFHAAGVPFLTGSGAVAFGVLPGWGEHRELALLVRAGLTPREALAAATGNYAALYGWKDVGRIAPGFRGDLVVLDADPTASIENVQSIHSVYLCGREIDRGRLLAYRPDMSGPAH